MTAPTAPGRVVARAPGRVNLIGDHTDYCGGLALPMAIDRWTEVTYAPGASRHLVLTTDADRRPAVIDLDAAGAEGAPENRGAASGQTAGTGESGGGGDSQPSWSRLARALVDLVAPSRGGRAEIRSTLPVGAGLSSSAAFSVALALALGATAEPERLARLCQRAESAAGSDVGLLDPLAIAAARAGHAVMIDFGRLVWTHVPVPDTAQVVVVHSGTARRLQSSPYRLRRAECEAAAAELGVALGAAGEGDPDRVADRRLRARARHVVTECRRVRQVAAALAAGDLATAGAAMTESHRSLADDFEASTLEVDALVAELVARPGVHGARMTGGGFGGCVVALATPGALDPDEWPRRCWVVRPVGAARRTPADVPVRR